MAIYLINYFALMIDLGADRNQEHLATDSLSGVLTILLILYRSVICIVYTLYYIV